MYNFFSKKRKEVRENPKETKSFEDPLASWKSPMRQPRQHSPPSSPHELQIDPMTVTRLKPRHRIKRSF
jgi:hypothetical protein